MENGKIAKTKKTHGVVPPRLDDVDELDARMEEEEVPPLLVRDVQRVVLGIDSAI